MSQDPGKTQKSEVPATLEGGIQGCCVECRGIKKGGKFV